MKPLTPLRSDVTIRAFTQAPGAAIAATAAFVIYERETLLEFLIGVTVGVAAMGVGHGWLMWMLRRNSPADSPAFSPLPANAVIESEAETRRHHLVRVPVYLALDAVVIAVFAIIGAGLLLATIAMSVVLGWRLKAWEERRRIVLFSERRKAWEFAPRKPYWFTRPAE